MLPAFMFSSQLWNLPSMFGLAYSYGGTVKLSHKRKLQPLLLIQDSLT